MSTFWQLLRIGFWMLPLQRALTLIGAVILIAGQLLRLPLNMPGSTLPITFFGASLMFLVPLLAGGVFLRMLSSSRALLLRPHARGKLLAGALSILVLVTALWMVCYWLAFLPVPEKFKPDAEDYLLMYGLSLSFGSQCAITLFIASRSPLWTLIVLVLWQVPALLLHVLGVEDASRLFGGPISLMLSAVAWLVFGIWFMRAQRIHASAWRRSDAATAVESVVPAPIQPRAVALSRWVLTNGTPIRIGALWLVACLVMLAIQWVLGRESSANVRHAVAFGSLSAVTLVIGPVASSMARSSRALWLSAGLTRTQLYGWIERRMLEVASAVLFAVVLVALLYCWLMQARPALPLAYLLPMLLLPGLCAGWLGLMQQHSRSFIDALAGVCIGAVTLYGVVAPVYVASAQPNWNVLTATAALALLLRSVAYVRWRDADWRRAQNHTASGVAS